MAQLFDRRIWLKNTALAIGGISISGISSANNRNDFFPPTDSIRLHANENPYGPSASAKAAMAGAVNSSNRYPWDVTTQLREKIAAKHNLTKDNIMMGAGSSEILGLVAQFAALQSGNAIAADPTFGIWFTSAAKGGLEIVKVPLTIDKKHDLQRMKEKLNNSTRLMYICNPNNPTGTVLPINELGEFINQVSKQTLVLLDEAYTEYSDEDSLTSLVKNNPNLVIAKTFSKIYGLAGARIGYAIAHHETINKLTDLQPWANAGVSAVSLAGALASLDDHSFVQTSKTKNAAVREFVCQSFKEHDISFIPSHTNFIYYSVKNQQKDFLGLLAENNIRAGRLSDNAGMWTRISIGTESDMKIFTQLLKQSFKS